MEFLALSLLVTATNLVESLGVNVDNETTILPSARDDLVSINATD